MGLQLSTFKIKLMKNHKKKNRLDLVMEMRINNSNRQIKYEQKKYLLFFFLKIKCVGESRKKNFELC